MPAAWQPDAATATTGGFGRWSTPAFTGRVSADGATGFPAEPGRYHLYASLACPWSHQILITRRLLGLESVLGVTLTDPITGEHGWRFPDSSGGRDPLTGARWLSELYLATDPGYSGRAAVPVLWDTGTRQIVSNHPAHITVMLETEFAGFHRRGAPDLYPPDKRADIEALATLIHHTVSTGVYRAGLATDQASYEQAFDGVFTTLDALDERLSMRRFLFGNRLSEADVRLFPTLVRFDAVYYLHFKCNLRRLIDYRNLWGYARDLYQRPGFGDTTDFGEIKRHFYQTQPQVNPSRLVPKGPFVSWLGPHGRDRLQG
jgi:putative glutathione S-transferase